MAATLEDLLKEIQASRPEVGELRNQMAEEFKGIRETLSAIPELKTRIEALEHENTTIKTELSRLSTQVNLHEQHTKAKNLVMYGLPGLAGESRSTTESIVSKVFAKTNIKKKIVIAHRIGSRENSPVVIEFTCKPEAQDAFHQLRKAGDVTLQALSLGESGRVEVRFHLSTFLSNLLKSANVVKKDAGWTYCRPFTSDQTVELVRSKDDNAERIKIGSMEELMKFRDKLIEDGSIAPNSPAATLKTTDSNGRKRQRTIRPNTANKQARMLR